eukprot:2327196-Rhodomonas_salina.1
MKAARDSSGRPKVRRPLSPTRTRLGESGTAQNVTLLPPRKDPTGPPVVSTPDFPPWPTASLQTLPSLPPSPSFPPTHLSLQVSSPLPKYPSRCFLRTTTHLNSLSGRVLSPLAAVASAAAIMSVLRPSNDGETSGLQSERLGKKKENETSHCMHMNGTADARNSSQAKWGRNVNRAMQHRTMIRTEADWDKHGQSPSQDTRGECEENR